MSVIPKLDQLGRLRPKPSSMRFQKLRAGLCVFQSRVNDADATRCDYCGVQKDDSNHWRMRLISMRVPSPYRCDYCGARKQEANHWWLRVTDYEGFVLWPWSDSAASSANVEHICSQACASKALSRWMENSNAIPG